MCVLPLSYTKVDWLPRHSGTRLQFQYGETGSGGSPASLRPVCGVQWDPVSKTNWAVVVVGYQEEKEKSKKQLIMDVRSDRASSKALFAL